MQKICIIPLQKKVCWMHLLNLWRLICKKRTRTERGSKYQMHCIKINLKNMYPQKVVIHVRTTIQATVFMWISAQCRSLLRWGEHITFPRVLRFYHLLHSRPLEEYMDVPAPLCSERGLFHSQETGCDFLCNAGDRDLHASRFGLVLDRQNRTWKGFASTHAHPLEIDSTV
jgi:hypothetical protein